MKINRLSPMFVSSTASEGGIASSDGTFVFFHRRGDIYWMSVSILKKYLASDDSPMDVPGVDTGPERADIFG